MVEEEVKTRKIMSGSYRIEFNGKTIGVVEKLFYGWVGRNTILTNESIKVLKGTKREAVKEYVKEYIKLNESFKKGG